MKWICDPKVGGCGFIGDPSDYHREELMEDGVVVSAIDFCPVCNGDHACYYSNDVRKCLFCQKEITKDDLKSGKALYHHLFGDVCSHHHGVYKYCNELIKNA